jgi:adenylate kinase
MALNVVMMGPPGAGKGTQAGKLAVRYGLPKISTGDMLRDAAARRTRLGLEAKAVMDRGDLVSDDIMIGVVRERLDLPDARNGFVLDGFPRTVPQAKALDDLMIGRDPLIIVKLMVLVHEIIRRLHVRRLCSSCGTMSGSVGLGPDGEPVAATICPNCGSRMRTRDDDEEEVVRERLRVYQRETKPLADFYEGRPSFRCVVGTGLPEVVGADVAMAVESAARDVGAMIVERTL